MTADSVKKANYIYITLASGFNGKALVLPTHEERCDELTRMESKNRSNRENVEIKVACGRGREGGWREWAVT